MIPQVSNTDAGKPTHATVDKITTVSIPALGGSRKRKHELLIMVRLDIPALDKRRPQEDMIFLLREAIKGWLDFLKNSVDGSTQLYRYIKRHDDERDAVSKGSEIPKTITGIQSYGQNLRFRDETAQAVFGSFRVGFNAEPAVFMNILLKAARGRGMWVQKNALQEANTETVGFLIYSGQNHDPVQFAELLNHYSETRINNKDRSAVRFGAEVRIIFDGAVEEERKARTADQKSQLRAIHVIAAKGEFERARRVMNAYLESDDFKSNYNVPFRCIRTYRRGEPPRYYARFRAVLSKHVTCATRHTQWTEGSDVFGDLDKPIQMLKGNPTTRHLIMQLKASNGKKLFLSVDRQNVGFKKGSFCASYPAVLKEEAEATWRHLPKHLQRHFGDGALAHLTQDVLDDVEKLGWDEENNCPISINNLELSEALDDKASDAFLVDCDLDKLDINGDESRLVVERPDSPTEHLKPMPENRDEDSFARFNTLDSAATDYTPHVNNQSAINTKKMKTEDQENKPIKGTQMESPANPSEEEKPADPFADKDGQATASVVVSGSGAGASPLRTALAQAGE